MNEKTLKTLEFDKILKMLSEMAAMDITKDVRGEDFVILVIDTAGHGVQDLVHLRMK